MVTGKSWRHYWPWLNLGLTTLLIVAGVWYLSNRISLAAIGAELLKASAGYTALAVAIMALTIVLKAWRWQLMYPAEHPPIRFTSAFWALSLGQYVNLVVPFLRLGEVARIYALNQENGTSGGRTLGTLVVEKTLDLVFFGLTIIFVLPFAFLPDYIQRPGALVIILPLALLVVLYLLAYQTDLVIRLWRKAISPLPQRLQIWLLKLAVAGLEGLAALRNRRLILLLLMLSLMIAILAVALPYVLFPALDLPLTVLDAALIHIVVSLAIAPPSTPAKIGVFNGAAAFMLWQSGLTDEAAVAGYAILLYLVVVAPQIALGIIAASRSKWRWRSVLPLDVPISGSSAQPSYRTLRNEGIDPCRPESCGHNSDIHIAFVV